METLTFDKDLKNLGSFELDELFYFQLLVEYL